MNLADDDFTLFGLPKRFEQSRADIDVRWKALQAEVHPDRFASEGLASQRVAMQWAVRVNEAYRRLKDPLKRAALLCELHGMPVDEHDNTAMPADFLMQQMAWREELEDARGSAAVDALADEMNQHRAGLLNNLQAAIDQRQDWPAAAQQVRALMFIERFAQDVEARLDALEQ